MESEFESTRGSLQSADTRKLASHSAAGGHKPKIRHSNPEGLVRDPAMQRYRCRHCHFQAAVPRQITMHEERYHLEKKYACSICGRRYGSEFIVQEHARLTHLADTKTQTMCETCGKTVVKSRLAAHVRKVHSKELRLAQTGKY